MSRYRHAMLAWILAAGTGMGGEPPLLTLVPAVRPNQQLADSIASQLRSSGILRQYRIEITCNEGTVLLEGIVANGQHRDEASRLVFGVPGVKHVLNNITVRGNSAMGSVTQAQLQQNELPPPQGVPSAPIQPELGNGGSVVGPVLQDPQPIYTAPIGEAGANQAPPLPPYAWPTYAPYNNYSRVAYPNTYPYEAFPAIGPIYPFPKAPLGWRSVKLEWNDGHWWLSTHGQKRDSWVLRFW